MSDDERPETPGDTDPGSAPESAVVTDTPSDDSTSEPTRRRRLPKLRWWQEGGLLLLGAVLLAVVIKSFVVQAYYIPSESMEPGLERNDRIAVQKVSYWFGGSPSRGDVVVFEDPGGWLDSTTTQTDQTPGGVKGVLAKIGLYPSGGHLVKRVIGVPGDVIECCDDQGRIMVNGEPLDESEYLAVPPEGETPVCNAPETGTCEWSAGPVPKGTVFVLGDNRYRSADSAAHLCVDTETECTDVPYIDDDLVTGKVYAVVWPRDHLDKLSRPGVFDGVPDPQ